MNAPSTSWPPAFDEAYNGLIAKAEFGGPEAAAAARRAALLAIGRDQAKAARAFALASKLDPLDSGVKLALGRLKAQGGDLETARRQAAAVFSSSIDEGARARAAFLLGEIARLRGDGEEARDAYLAARRLEEALLRVDPSDVEALRGLARALGRLAELDLETGDRAAAQPNAEAALAMLTALAGQIGEDQTLAADIAEAQARLGALDLAAGDARAARRRHAAARGRYEALAVAEPSEPHWRDALADLWARDADAALLTRDRDGARAAIDRALALRLKLAAADDAEAWPLAGLWRRRAGLLEALGDPAGAADNLAQARGLAVRLCAERPDAAAPARFLIHTLLDQADLLLRAGALEPAQQAADQARAHAEARANEGKAPAPWLTLASAAWDRLAEVARAAGATAALLDALARAVEFRRLASEADPEQTGPKRGLAAALLKHGEAALAAGETRSAQAAFAESFAVRLGLAEAAPGEAGPVQDMAAALERLGLAALALGDSQGARAALEEELSLAERLFADADHADALRFTAIVESHLAGLGGPDAADHRVRALSKLDRLAQAGALTEREMKLRTKLWGAGGP